MKKSYEGGLRLSKKKGKKKSKYELIEKIVLAEMIIKLLFEIIEKIRKL